MSELEAVFERYKREYTCFEQAALELEKLLKEGCARMGLRAEVESRAKTIPSFIKKIYARSYDDPWLEVTDKVGGRIITETLLDRKTAARLFDESTGTTLISVLSMEDKSDGVDPQNLYYPGIHVQGIVPEFFTSDGQPIECEIQLRTKAQDAWAVASHGRIYKGILPLSKRTTRRIYRLSVLTEMFDEEVKTAMDEMCSEPEYEHAVLIRDLETLYLPMTGEPGENMLSLEVLDVLKSLVDVEGREKYFEELKKFVEENSSKISGILSDYGPRSDFANQWAYWLFSQPESLLIFEKVENHAFALSEAVEGTEMEEAFRHLFEAWGKEMASTDI